MPNDTKPLTASATISVRIDVHVIADHLVSMPSTKINATNVTNVVYLLKNCFGVKPLTSIPIATFLVLCRKLRCQLHYFFLVNSIFFQYTGKFSGTEYHDAVTHADKLRHFA
jgi:hypothetical protein